MAVQIIEYPNRNSMIPLRVAAGHFATNHSHINYYVDLTMTKCCLAEARAAALELASKFENSTLIDTILCLDGTEVIGACMASELTRAGFASINANHTIYVVTPEHTVGSQLIFRENISPMITDKHVLILAASVATGYTAQEAVNVLHYYNGIPVGICSIFARAKECAGFPVISIFDSSLLPDYMSVAAHECPLCKAKIRLDAMVNTFGISSF
ncbi:MAG: phosphoribosyltransferase [Oscillibacter sp.]|nr:phosphoribosyltransferase [Oscillibacter sp.]